jgi:translation elongation factor EF-G
VHSNLNRAQTGYARENSVNKIDRNILGLKLHSEAMHQNFARVVDMVNVIISTYQSGDMGEIPVEPNKVASLLTPERNSGHSPSQNSQNVLEEVRHRR